MLDELERKGRLVFVGAVYNIVTGESKFSPIFLNALPFPRNRDAAQGALRAVFVTSLKLRFAVSSWDR